MPAKPRWLLHIPEILAELRQLDVPVLDRLAFERLFQVRRRRALDLMQGFGGYRAGNTILIDRLALIRQLELILDSPDMAMERRRKRRFVEKLDALRRHQQALQVKIPVEPPAWRRRFPDLPQGVELEPGRLRVEFSRTEELLQRLFEVARAAANDYDTFQATIEKNQVQPDAV